MDRIQEHERVVLRTDLSGGRFVAGDVGTVVHVHREGTMYEVEFVALDGESFAVVTVDRAQVRRIERGEIAHARRVA